jgi:hypothetical protein
MLKQTFGVSAGHLDRRHGSKCRDGGNCVTSHLLKVKEITDPDFGNRIAEQLNVNLGREAKGSEAWT